MRPQIRQRDLSGLSHHLAQLTGEREARFARHGRRFDEQHVATGAGDRETCRDAGGRDPFDRLVFGHRAPEGIADLVDGDGHRRRRAVGDGRRGLAHQSVESLLESPDTGFTGVAGDDGAHDLVAQHDFVGLHAVAFVDARHQVIACDRQLLDFAVAADRDQLHAIEQRCGHAVECVRGCDEHHRRQVEFELEIVIAEGVVLRRIEHFEQRRRRVAPPIGAELVDLVEQHHGVHRTGVDQRPHDATGTGADVGAPMATDLGFVVDAAERGTDELATEGTGDRLAERRLAHTRGADEHEDGAGTAMRAGVDIALGPQLAHGEELDDAVLDLVETGVVRVEDGAGVGEVVVVVGARIPRQLEDGVEPCADPARLHRLFADPFEAIDLLEYRVADGIGDIELGQTRAVVGDGVVATLTELLADGFELAAQDDLALVLLESVADVARDRRGDVGLGERVAGPVDGLVQPLFDVDRLEEIDLLIEVEVGPPADGVGQRAGGPNVVEQAGELAPADRVEQLAGDLAVGRGQLGDGRRGFVGVEAVDLHPQRRGVADDALADADAGDAAHHCGQRAVGQRAGLLDAGQRADPGVDAVAAGHDHEFVAGLCVLEGAAGVIGLGPDGHDHLGEYDAG